jgi:hypothetical protein
LISAWVTQLVTTIFIRSHQSIYPAIHLKHTWLNYETTTIALQAIQVAFGLFLFFIHLFEGRKGCRKQWIVIGPMTHTMVAGFNFMVAPAASFLWFLISIQDGTTFLMPLFAFPFLVSMVNLVILVTFGKTFLLDGFKEAAYRAQLRNHKPQKCKHCNLHQLGGKNYIKKYIELKKKVFSNINLEPTADEEAILKQLS